MILQFKVKNFRSIKDEIKIDFFANNIEDITQFPGYFVNDKKEKILKGITLIGNNASGKTNVLNALYALYMAVVSTLDIVETKTLDFVVPFLFDEDTSSQPCSFELLFEENGVRYLYLLSLTKEEIYHEKLSFAPNGRMVTLFDRERDKGATFHSTYVSSDNERLIQERNLKNKPIVTFSAQFNIPYLKDAYQFFAGQLLFTNGQGLANEQGIGLRLLSDEGYHLFLKSLMKASDLSIDDVLSTKRTGKVMVPLLSVDGRENGFSFADQDIYHVTTNHKVKEKEYSLSILDESLGTQKVLAYSGAIYDALSQGKTIIYDEFGSSLHPHVSAFLLSLFFDDTVNTRHAQILFNTQETNLLSEQILRRDEIYLVEKNKDDSSTMVSCLKEYAVRKKENIEMGYLNGRYSLSPDIDGGKIKL